jgi:hypothetical protein
MPARREYFIETLLDPESVWAMYTDWEHWHAWEGSVYGEVQWLSGRPFEKGSVVLIEIPSVGITFEQRIIGSTPPRELGWINHASGMTAEQWTYFHPLEHGGTRVETWIEIHGAMLELHGQPVDVVVGRLITTWYDRFKEQCDRRAQSN